MSSSNLSRNKLTVPVGLSTPKNNRLRSELRRVMSDRVLKITRCSQQQNVEKTKQRLDSSTATPPSSNPSLLSTPVLSQNTTSTDIKSLKTNDLNDKFKQNKSPLVSPSSTTIPTNFSQASSPNISASNLQNNSNISPTNSSNDSTGNTKSNKISLQPFKIFGKFT